MRIVLYEPEIPPNTGNVARLCAAMNLELHLIEPLGFKIDDKHLKRAGLDYWPHVQVTVHADWQAFLDSQRPDRLVMTSARTGTPYHTFGFQKGDWLVFGPETRGLPSEITDGQPHLVRIPIRDRVRSLNLSTATGIITLEALRQTGELDTF